MRNLITVFRKEVAGFFHRPHAYMFIGVYFFLCAFFFNQALKRFTGGMLNLIRQNPNMLDMINLNDHLFEPFSYTMGVVLLFVVMVLTMAAFAEERSKGTFELLMTSPVRLIELVLGKYFAALFVFTLALALTWLFPLFLWIYGSMEMAPVWTAYLGLFLAGAAFLAIGIFWSTVFESQVVAALVTFGNLLLFWLVGMADSGDSSFLSDLARNCSAVLHLVGFTKGKIQLVDVVFYGSVIGFFLFLAHRALEWHRWSQGPSRKLTSFYGRFAGIASLPLLIGWVAIKLIVRAPTDVTDAPSSGMDTVAWAVLGVGLLALLLFIVFELKWIKEVFLRRSSFYGANTIIYSAIVAVVVVMANVLAIWNPAKLDLTADRLYTLNAKTVNLLEGLQAEVKVTGFFVQESQQEQQAKNQLKALLDRYREHTGKLEYEFVDPMRNPALAKQFGINQRSERIVVESGGKQARVQMPTEEGLTNGLLQVTKKSGRSVCFTTGHGEADLSSSDAGGYSQAKKLLEDNRYTVETLDLLHAGETPSVPTRCRVVVAAGPRYAFQAPEVKAIRDYLRGGGRGLFLFEPDSSPGLDGVLAEYGIGLNNDHVVDVGVRLQDASPYTVTAQNYGQHEITKGLGGFAFSKFPMARSLKKAEKNPPGTTVTELVKTTRRSFGETELTAEGPAYDPDKDLRGPLTLALAAKKTLPKSGDTKKEIRVVAFGDAEFAGNSQLHFMVNSSLFSNCVHWLAEEADLIAFPVKKRKGSTLFLTENQQNLILVSSVLLVPLAVILAGLFVRMARRGR